jgi:hypothetical protein
MAIVHLHSDRLFCCDSLRIGEMMAEAPCLNIKVRPRAGYPFLATTVEGSSLRAEGEANSTRGFE